MSLRSGSRKGDDMEFTPKQERNGATGATAARNTAVPGPDATAVIAAAIGSAMSTERFTATVFDRPAGDATVVDWETGVAGHDMPGEA